MKKTTLLSLLVFSLCGFSSVLQAEVNDYWIIKDGVLNEDIVQMPYDSKEVSVYDTLVSGQEATDGTIAAAYLHKGAQYKDVRFDLSKAPLDLNIAWILEVEYMAPYALDSVSEDAKTYASYSDASLLDGTKSGLRMGLDHNKDSMAVDNMDATFSVQLVYDALKSGDQWTTVERFVYANPDSLVMNIFVLSYVREGKLDLSNEPLYIKNLKFKGLVGPDSKKISRPFYAEDFTPVGSGMTSDFSNGTIITTTTEVWHGGVIPEGTNVSCVRFWDKPYDASGLFAADMPHAMTVASKDRNINNIALNTNEKYIQVEALIKANPNTKQTSTWEAALDSPEDRPMPAISLIFDDAATTSVVLFPDSALNGIWTWNTSDSILIPEGATHCSLNIPGATQFNYAINQIRIGGPIAGTTDISNTDAEGFDALIYIKGDDLIVEGASQVEVISMTSVVLASTKGSSVNVSGLVAGPYIVRAYVNGAVVAKTIFINK